MTTPPEDWTAPLREVAMREFAYLNPIGLAALARLLREHEEGQDALKAAQHDTHRLAERLHAEGLLSHGHDALTIAAYLDAARSPLSAPGDDNG